MDTIQLAHITATVHVMVSISVDAHGYVKEIARALYFVSVSYAAGTVGKKMITANVLVALVEDSV